MSNTNEEESLFSELGKFEELQSPFHLFPVLHRELESLNRLKRNREKSVLVSSVLSGLHLGNDSQNQEETLDLSGTRLGNHLENPEAKQLCSKLASNPMDSSSRQELLGMLLEQRESANLQMSRDGYLLSMFELESPQLNSEKINTALYCQELYLIRLHEKLREMALKFSQKVQGDGSEKDNELREKANELKQGITYIQNCSSILKTTPLTKKFELDLRPGKVGKKISNKELSEGYDPFSRRLSHLPLVDISLNQMLEIMRLLERNNPLVGYHQSMKHEILARLAFADALLTKDSKKEREGADQFSKALIAVQQAMALVGYAPNRSVEIATVVRFGQIVYMVAKIYRLHQIPLPKGHQELMNKAVRALQKVSEDKNAKIIQQNLLNFKEQSGS